MKQENGAILYNINELSEDAKNRAREYVIDYIGNDYAINSITNFIEIAKIIGLDIDESYNSNYMNANVYYELECQGAGACFEGDYSYVPDSSKNIREKYKSEELLEIAENLEKLQKKYNNEISVRITHNSRNYHEESMTFDIELDSENDYVLSDEDEEAIEKEFKNLAKWLYREIRDSYHDYTSNEYVDEYANNMEIMFLINGTTI